MFKRCVVLLVWMVGVAATASGQFVSGEWVQRGEASIRQYRTTPVKFLVLDAEGRLAADAEVRVQQLEHAFAIGFLAGETFPAAYDAEALPWRVFNHVALDRLTPWRALQPTREGGLQTDELDAAMDAAEAGGLAVRWGSLLSAGAFDLPDWVVPLEGAALYDAAGGYAEAVLGRYGRRVADLDLAEQTLDDDRYSPAMLRLLGMRVTRAVEDVPARLRYRQAFEGQRVFDVLSAADTALNLRMGLGGFTLDQTFSRAMVEPEVLDAALRRLARLAVPLWCGRLEVGGDHPIEAAVNLEVVLRTLFAQPMVRGIYFAGVTAEELAEPSAALLDETGQVTGPGRVLDTLFRREWWTDTTLTTGELGEAETRVYLGTHRVTATLADGSTVEAVIDLPRRSDDARLVILQPVGR